MTNKYIFQKSKKFLEEYIKEHNIECIADLFDKETLIEFVYDDEWEWAVEDEMFVCNVSEDIANENTREWFMSMSNEELLYEHISTHHYEQLIIDKAKILREIKNIIRL